MKKIVSIFLFACLLCAVFSGCDAQKSAGQSDPQNPNSLTVYYTNDWDFAKIAPLFRQENKDCEVQAVRFSSAAELEDQLIQELNTNRGPDVVLLDGLSLDYSVSGALQQEQGYHLDLHKLALAGGFLPLDEYFENDPDFHPDDYLLSAFEACVVDEKQYFMPLAIKVLTGFYEGALFDTSPTQGVTSFEEYMQAATEQINQGGSEDFLYYKDGCNNDGAPFVDMLLTASGLDWTAMDRDFLDVHQDAFRKIIDWTKLAYEAEEKNANALSGQESPALPTYLFQSYRPMFSGVWDNLVEYGLLGMEDMRYFYPPRFDDSARYTAKISRLGFLTKDCKNPELGYRFLKFYMDTYGSQVAGPRYNSVKRQNFSYGVQYLMNMVKNAEADSDFSPAITRLTDQDFETMQSVYDNITECRLSNRKIIDIILQEFQSYFHDSDSFENCFAALKNKWSLYLDE